MSVTFVEANHDAGFSYPYYLTTPDSLSDGDPVPILVEGTNTSVATDAYETIRTEAEHRATGGFARRVADELGVPFLHPVFPRPRSDPVDWTHYTHSLDRETIRLSGGPLERLDRQLLCMVDEARERLAESGIATREEFSLNGFSASGTFANRFAALHPDRVLSVTAGGLNGMAILPTTEIEPHVPGVDQLPLPYPVGVADVQELTGEPFDLDAFRSVNQFLYLGEDDDNDTLLYPDAWTGPEVRLSAIFAYGEDILEERFPACRAIYEEMDTAAVFRVYEGAGHEPLPAFDDVVEFHRRSIAGDEIAEIRANLGGTTLA